jgi:hypothetical protein
MKGEPLPCPDQLDRPPAQILLQARKPTHEPDFDREPFDLPPELRWWEWKARVEAVLFAAAKPVTRDILARVSAETAPSTFSSTT